jgi:hypothetical protein
MEWVDIGFGAELASGLGIYADDRFIYHTFIANADFSSHVTVLDRSTFEILNVQRLAGTLDGHSLRRIDNELFVASTGTDQIIAYPMEGLVLGSPRVVWSPSNALTDTHHVNSLAYVDGDLFCSAFGPKDDGSWSTTRNGYVRNVTTGATVLDGLRQPHSATWHDGQLYVCNSIEGSVNAGSDPVVFLTGYARGLTFASDGTLFAGTSLARRPTQPTDDPGVFRNPSDEGALHGQCAVVQMTPAGTNRVEISIPPFGNEIYDIVVL